MGSRAVVLGIVGANVLLLPLFWHRRIDISTVSMSWDSLVSAASMHEANVTIAAANKGHPPQPPAPPPEPPAVLRALAVLPARYSDPVDLPLKEGCEDIGSRVILYPADARELAAYRAPKALRVAIVLAGGLRSTKKCWPTALRHIIQPNPDVIFDVYVVTNDAHLEDCEDCNQTLSCEQQLHELYDPYLKAFRCLPPSALDGGFTGTSEIEQRTRHHYTLFALIRESFRLAVDSRIKYDVLARIRPDSYFFGSYRFLPIPPQRVAVIVNIHYTPEAPTDTAYRFRNVVGFVLRPHDVVAPWFVSCPDVRAGHDDPLGSMDDQFFFGPPEAMYATTNFTLEWYKSVWEKRRYRRVNWVGATEGLLYARAVEQGMRPTTVAGMPLRSFAFNHVLLRTRYFRRARPVAPLPPYQPN